MLLLDFDPQGALSVGLGVNPHEFDRTAYNLLVERDVTVDDVLLKTNMPGLDLLPSNIDLSAAEVQLVNEVAREHTLSRVLEPALADYDYVLIDCQPSLGLLTVNALTAAHGVLIPLECEFFALRGVALLMDTIHKVRDRLNPQLEVEGIVATMYDSRTLHGREVLGRLVEAFGETVFHTVIARTVRFPETTVAGEPITTYASSSNGAAAYRRSSDSLPPVRCRRGARPMSRRASLPGAAELFRSTGPVEDVPEPVGPSAHVAQPQPVERDATARPGSRPRRRAAAYARRPAAPRQDDRRPSGRERHDEKITVYVSADELFDLEQARLSCAGSTAWPWTAVGSFARPSPWSSRTSRAAGSLARSCEAARGLSRPGRAPSGRGAPRRGAGRLPCRGDLHPCRAQPPTTRGGDVPGAPGGLRGPVRPPARPDLQAQAGRHRGGAVSR